MVNAQQVLGRVAANRVAPNWQVLRVRTGYLVGRVIVGIFGVVIGGLGAGFGLFFAVGGSAAFGATQIVDPSMQPLVLVLLPLVVATIFAVVGVIFLLNGLGGLSALMKPVAQRPVLVLLPEGVVERGGMFGGRVRAVGYGDVAHAQMRITTTRTVNANTGATTNTSVQHAVVFTHRDGRKETWKMDGAYGRPDDVISRILTAQIQYNALRAPGR